MDGDIRVSDLSIKVTAPYATATTGYLNPTYAMYGWMNYGVYDVILFMGKNPTNAVLERVSMEGVQDNNLDLGYNVTMGVDYSSYYPLSSTPGDYCFLTGNFTVQNCTFKNMFAGISFDGRHKDNHVIIGGSPDSGNVCENSCVALDLEPAQNSVFDVSFNKASASWAALWEYNAFSTNLGDFTPTPSYFLIHDNRFTAIELGPGGPGSGAWPGTEGIVLVDNPASPWIRASINSNKIDCAQGSLCDGILLSGTKGTSVWHNRMLAPTLSWSGLLTFDRNCA